MIYQKRSVHPLGSSMSWQLLVLVCGPFDAALRLLCNRPVDPTSLITDRVPLQDGAKALEQAQRPDALKVLIATQANG